MATKKNNITWENRTVKVSELKEWPENPRTITEAKFNRLVKLMEKFGFTQPAIVNRDFMVICGHQRRKAKAKKDGIDTTIEIRYPSRQLSPEEMMELAISDNLDTGVFDIDKLKSMGKPDEALKLFGKNEINLLEKLKAPGRGFGVAGTEKTTNVSVSVQKTETIKPIFQVIIECDDPTHQKQVNEWLSEHGYESKIVTI